MARYTKICYFTLAIKIFTATHSIYQLVVNPINTGVLISSKEKHILLKRNFLYGFRFFNISSSKQWKGLSWWPISALFFQANQIHAKFELINLLLLTKKWQLTTHQNHHYCSLIQKSLCFYLLSAHHQSQCALNKNLKCDEIRYTKSCFFIKSCFYSKSLFQVSTQKLLVRTKRCCSAHLLSCQCTLNKYLLHHSKSVFSAQLSHIQCAVEELLLCTNNPNCALTILLLRTKHKLHASHASNQWAVETTLAPRNHKNRY